MTLLEILAMLVGPAIGRAILRAWLDDGDIAEELTGSIVEIVRAKTTDVLAQRRATRQFEAIGESIAVALLPLFEAEQGRLQESSRKAVAQAIAETLAGSRITAILLAQLNLEPARLAQYLIANYPQASIAFSEVETNFYYRILNECSVYIVDTASQLPAFTERTLSVILQRENELLQLVTQLLHEVQKIRDASQRWSSGADAARFETEYLRTIVRKLDEMELFGADVSRASRNHPLSIAYVNLLAKLESNGGNQGPVLLPVDKVLDESRYLLIQGLAGSGKTTLLKWIAVQAALRRFEGRLVDWNKSIPFFVRLRHFTNKSLPTPQDFPGLIAPHIIETMPKGWVDDQLNTMRTIILVDGVDEIPFSQRDKVREWIMDLVDTFKYAHFIVTSRPSAIEEGWLPHQQFDYAELQPMELNDIFKLIDQWHKAVGTVLQDRKEKEKLEPLAHNLKQILRADKGAIRNLAQSPLLCAMICALHRERRQQLPSDRIELYEDCCRMLLDRRDRERNIKLGAYPNLDYRQKKRLMQGLSYWMLNNGWTQVDVKSIDDHFERQLKRMGNRLQKITGADVRRYFVDRSGMVRFQTSEQITFTHRTFQEYFAAQSALDEGDIGVLVKNATDDQWLEVILLAAGLANPKQAAMLIEGILQQGDKAGGFLHIDNQMRRKMYILAAKCANATVSVAPAVLEKIRKRLARLIPPKNYTQAAELAETAPLITPYLHYNEKYSERDAIACVHVLRLIGSNSALNVLRSYTQDARSRVNSQLLEAWDAFDRASYLKQILAHSHLSEIEHLQLSSISPLPGALRHLNLHRFKQLSIGNCREKSDLDFIGSLTQLTALALYRGKQITTLEPLTKLINLRYLSLSDFDQLIDLRPLVKLINLRHLSLRNCDQLTNLVPLTFLPQLEHLSLYRSQTGSVPNVSDVLKKWEGLKSLTLSGFSKELVDAASQWTRAKVRKI